LKTLVNKTYKDEEYRHEIQVLYDPASSSYVMSDVKVWDDKKEALVVQFAGDNAYKACKFFVHEYLAGPDFQKPYEEGIGSKYFGDDARTQSANLR